MADNPDGATPGAADDTAEPPGAPDTDSGTGPRPAPEPAAPETHRHAHSRHKKRAGYRVYRRRRRIVWALVIAACCIILASAWVAFQLWQAHDHLEATAGLVTELQQNLKDGDAHAAHVTLGKLQQEAGAAHSEAHDFLWSTAEHLPGIGPNLQAVRVIADAIDELSWTTLPPLVDVAASLDPAQIAPRNGAIDVTVLQQAAPKVTAAASAIHDLQRTVDDIDPEPLLPVVANAVGELHDKLTRVGRLADTAAKAAQLLPPMLGADGKRTYLVVFQNNAELRATGGIFGAYALISADHGRITLDKQGSTSADIKKFDPPMQELPANLQALYTDLPAVYPMDVNLTPDFPTAAKLIREMYRQRFGVQVDGVIATDPVALSEVLQGTGPVDLPTGNQLTAANTVAYLLSQAYRGTTPAQSNALFQQAARSVFAAMVSGQGSATATLAGLEKAAAQRRLLVWSATDAEQNLLATTVLGGRLPTADAATPTVGVYLNDGTGGKMDFYLRETVSLQASGCRSDGRMVMAVTVTVTSTAPSSGLPNYVTGLALAGKYVTRTNVMVFSPVGGAVQDARIDGQHASLGSGTENGRFVGVLTVDLQPGESITIHATVLSGPAPATGTTGMQLLTTPLSTPATIDVGRPRACTPADASPNS